MARKASILDVLREAQSQAQPAQHEAAPAVEATPDKSTAGATAPAPRRNGTDGELERSERGPVDWRGWLGKPVRLQRGVVYGAALLLLALVWVSFELGKFKGRRGGPDAAPPHNASVAELGDRSTKPGRMRDERRQASGALVSNPGQNDRARRGYRVASFPMDQASKPAPRALVRFLERHLAGTGVEVAWLDDRGRLLVAVLFPNDKADDTVWASKLADRIRALRPDKGTSLGVDFAGLSLEPLRGMIKSGR